MRVSATKTYDILIGDGLIDRCGEEIAALFRPARLALVTDEAVDSLFGKRVMKSLKGARFDVHKCIVPRGESAKSARTLATILDFLGEKQFTRTDQLVWLGGGSVGDVAALAASLYMHGMYTVQIPTTLVAAIDSSVGGRASIHLNAGRDLVGAVSMPSLVLCDMAVLGKLPVQLMRDGAAEILKYALLGSEPLLQTIESGLLIDNLDVAIDLCVRIKADLLEHDDHGALAWRALQIGSLVGRAAQACSGGELSHGEGLAIGLVAVTRAATRMLNNVDDCSERVERALRLCGLPVECPFGRGEMLTAIAAQCRKGEEYMTIAVPERVGECALRRVTIDALDTWLKEGGIGE